MSEPTTGDIIVTSYVNQNYSGSYETRSSGGYTFASMTMRAEISGSTTIETDFSSTVAEMKDRANGAPSRASSGTTPRRRHLDLSLKSRKSSKVVSRKRSWRPKSPMICLRASRRIMKATSTLLSPAS